MDSDKDKNGNFNETFKQQATLLVTFKRYTIRNAANAVGISEEMMMRWVLEKKKKLIKIHQTT